MTSSTLSTPASAKAAARAAMLSGPILATLARLATPTIAVLVAQTAVGVVETYYVSRLGKDALVGVSVVFPVWMLMTMMSAGGIGGGVSSAVARAIGGGRDTDADDLAVHAVILAVIAGAIFSVLAWLFGPILYAALGTTGGALAQALRYSDWLFLCAVPIWVVNLCSAALRGAGDVRTPARVSLAGIVVLVPLSPVLIFGVGPHEGLGIAGAGIAVTVFYSGAALFLLRLLRSGRGSLTLSRRPLRRELFGQILGVGLISSLSVIQLNLAVVLVTGAVGRFGSDALAGYGVGARLEYLLVPVLFGLGSAVLMMVGTCLGAGDVRRARSVAVAGILIGAAFASVIGAVVFVEPGVWLRLFTDDPGAIEAGAIYLRAMAFAYPALAVAFVLAFVSQGGGRPGWTTFAGTARLAIAGGAGWLAVEAGVEMTGLSIVVAAGQFVAAGVCAWAFMTRRLFSIR
ncbi:MATE family efflux transporter [Sphingomonas sp. MMS24-J45]|uniref:MATE family efflux transporter n=1 Tax=Sphingomonas sp. MMS24-J45 TaxID=3238806 RepID=UPI003850E4CF